MADPIDALLEGLWRDYVAVTPHAARIHALLAERGETVVNDHVALRGLGVPGLGLGALGAPFEALGWEPRERYRFDDKHLVAGYWQHPDSARPKVFISELCLDELSETAQAALRQLIAQVPRGRDEGVPLPRAGRPWEVTAATYQSLLAESEYAAWMAAFGFRVNHFTVDVGRLRTVRSIAEMNALLEAHGFHPHRRRLNRPGSSGGSDLTRRLSRCPHPASTTRRPVIGR